MRLIILVLMIVCSSCISFGSGSSESVVDRMKASCADEGGTWTSLGCESESRLLELECVEAGFAFASNACSVSVGKD